MESKWSLSELLGELHSEIQQKLKRAGTIGHTTTMGDSSEDTWLGLLNEYLPKRYTAIKGHVCDSLDSFSQQIDVIVFDRQYTPFVVNFQNTVVVPAESVYAVFESKQELDAMTLSEAAEKAESVRSLHRTSLPIPHAGGVFAAKPHFQIIAGALSFTSGWNPALGTTIVKHLNSFSGPKALDLVCVASSGIVRSLPDYTYQSIVETRPATAFLFELIGRLQALGTVPMIDIAAYARWLSPDISNASTEQSVKE